MKKAFKIIGVLLFLFIVFIIGIFIFLETFDFNRFKPQIISASQKALGRPIDFAKIDLKFSLKRGIQLRLTDITVAEHPDFGEGNFLTIKEVNFSVSVNDLILKRQIRILGIECLSPRVIIIRLKNGNINAQAFGAVAQDARKALSSQEQKPRSEPVQPVALGLSAIFINHINIDNARLTYIDYSFKPKLALVFDQIMFKAKFSMAEGAITFNSLLSFPDKGVVEFSGNISDYLLKQNYSAKVRINNINLAKCVNQSAVPFKVKGLVSGELEIKGQGFDPSAILSKLNGSGLVEIKEGQLANVNVFKMVLDKLSFVPDLGATLEAGLPERYKENLRKKGTAINDFKVVMGLSNGSVLIQSINVDAEGFLFQGSGLINLDQSYSLDGSFVIPLDLSAKMVESVSEMEYLLDEAKQIRFPLKISGKGASISFLPDVRQIGLSAIKHKVRQKLGDVLGNDESSDSKQQLIEGVLGKIFR